MFTAVNLKTIRIPGVLQRFSLTYLVLGLFEVCFSRYDTPEKYQVHNITDILKLLFWKVKTWYTVNSELNVRYSSLRYMLFVRSTSCRLYILAFIFWQMLTQWSYGKKEKLAFAILYLLRFNAKRLNRLGTRVKLRILSVFFSVKFKMITLFTLLTFRWYNFRIWI